MSIKKGVVPVLFSIIVFVAGVLFLLPVQATPENPREPITGKVVDAETGQALAAANILVTGTVYGTATSAHGEFTLELRPGRYILEVMCIGYQAVQQEITVLAGRPLALSISLKRTILALPQVVVTGTRTQKQHQDAPISTAVVTKDQIRNSGVTDLRGVLMEQTGLNIVNDHGQGVQVQGFDPDYTLVLLDGSPVVGRVAGTLDLTRFSVANIERIEIVKGPNSSLYGSEALAGVINIITREPAQPLAFNVTGRVGSFRSQDGALNVEWRDGRFGATVFYDRKARDHFKLTPATVSWSGPDFTNHTLSGNFLWQINERTKIKLNNRLFLEDQFSLFGLTGTDGVERLDNVTNLVEWNIQPLIETQLSPRMRFTAKAYLSRYLNENTLTFQKQGEVFSESRFDQRYRQGETQLDLILSQKQLLKFGAGLIVESVEADRIAGGRRSNRTAFAFFQHEWLPSRKFDLVASGRLDMHSEFGAHFSPKFAFLFKPHPNYRLRGSVGTGFKAPNFSQLYLDFTNAQIGYSVFGSTDVAARLADLAARGDVREILVAPSNLQGLQPETSTAFNFSIETTPFDFLRLQTNLFRNDVRDLIETQIIARKTNNQSVFTYFNLNRVFTTGIEAEAAVKFGKTLQLNLGYQYVLIKDKDVLDRIKAGTIFKKSASGRIRPVLLSEYGGLFNRSRNSGTIKLSYTAPNGSVVNLRTVLRGKYGLFDLNSNGILDDRSEYRDPYAMVNLNVTVPIINNLSLSVGVDNLFDYVDDLSFAGAPGRIVYAKFSFGWQKSPEQ